MINIDTLEAIGFENNEAKIYLALLELGETTIIPLSKKAGLPRTTCYFLVDKMADKGLLSKTARGAHTYFSASTPEKIREIAILNEQRSKNQRQLADEIVPQLVDLRRKTPKGPKIQYFSGRQGIRAIFDDLITSGATKDHYIGSTKACIKIAGEQFMKDWVKRRVKNGIFSYGVRVESEEEMRNTFRSSQKNLRQIKFAPSGAEFPVYISIYGNKVAFVTSDKEGFGMIIDSPDLSKTFRSIFNIIWASSKLYKEKGM